MFKEADQKTKNSAKQLAQDNVQHLLFWLDEPLIIISHRETELINSI